MKAWVALGVVALTAAAVGCIAMAARPRDGAVIHNTGSTNFSGYTIKIWSDGSASAVQSNRGGMTTGKPVSGRVDVNLAHKFFTDLKAAKESGHVISQSCMKSASFGSTTVVQYHGWTSPDLECPGEGFVVALAAEAHEIAQALQVRRAPVRRPLLPNEPRRVPESFPSQASPSPESSPPSP
jgi:hypothetical protein